MRIADIRSQLEEDLAWRLDELRHLRNQLLTGHVREDWPVSAMRTILVMQYAHLEGFARNAFSIYVSSINLRRLKADEVHPNLFATALVSEFDALRSGVNDEQDSEHGRLTRRARRQVNFVEKLRSLSASECVIEVDAAVSMEMNFGSDVLRRTLFRLGISESEVDDVYYSSLEFVRKTRNDIAHGSRRENIPPGLFEGHLKKCDEFMNELVRLITAAIASEWFRVEPATSGVRRNSS